MIEKQNVLSHRGLTLSRTLLRRLEKAGILTQSHVSLEHQHLARRYVVRGIESGGSVKEIGRYVTFCGPAGEPLPYLHPIDAVGVNGLHAVVVAPILVRIELFRTGRTCQLLVTRHEPAKVENGGRPPLESRILFRGVNGFVDADQDNKESDLGYSGMPRFWSRAGEEREIPVPFASAVRAATLGSKCCGCWHTHFSLAPVAAATTTDVFGE